MFAIQTWKLHVPRIQKNPPIANSFGKLRKGDEIFSPKASEVFHDLRLFLLGFPEFSRSKVKQDKYESTIGLTFITFPPSISLSLSLFLPLWRLRIRKSVGPRNRILNLLVQSDDWNRVLGRKFGDLDGWKCATNSIRLYRDPYEPSSSARRNCGRLKPAAAAGPQIASIWTHLCRNHFTWRRLLSRRPSEQVLGKCPHSSRPLASINSTFSFRRLRLIWGRSNQKFDDKELIQFTLTIRKLLFCWTLGGTPIWHVREARLKSVAWRINLMDSQPSECLAHQGESDIWMDTLSYLDLRDTQVAKPE